MPCPPTPTPTTTASHRDHTRTLTHLPSPFLASPLAPPQGFVDCALGENYAGYDDDAASSSPQPQYDDRRTACAQCLREIVINAVPDEIPGPVTAPYQTFGGTQVRMVPNHLASLRDTIFEALCSSLLQRAPVLLVRSRLAEQHNNAKLQRVRNRRASEAA